MYDPLHAGETPAAGQTGGLSIHNGETGAIASYTLNDGAAGNDTLRGNGGNDMLYARGNQ